VVEEKTSPTSAKGSSSPKSRPFGRGGLTINTKKESLSSKQAAERKEKKKKISAISENEVKRRYKIGGQVMESTHIGMEVKFATRIQDDHEVVIKTRLKKTSFEDKQEERQWRDTMTYQLNMPEIENICQFYEVLETPLKYYVVMEKIEGRDLFEQMTVNKLTHAEARTVVRHILEAVHQMHKAGRIHKDLKIENVMVDLDSPKKRAEKEQWEARFSSNDTVPGSPKKAWSESNLTVASESDLPPTPVDTKIIDFDTVVDYEPSSPRKETVVLGTNGYIAPEAYLGDYSPASDVYAVGVIMYKLLTRRFPYKSAMFDDKPGENWVGSSAMERIWKRLKREKINFNHPVLDACPPAQILLKKMLAFEAQNRGTAEEALQSEWFDLVIEGHV
jgi:Neu-associated kinase